MADFVTRLCVVVVLSAVSFLSRDLPFSIAGETQRVNVSVEEKRACSETRAKRSADQAGSRLLPSALQVRFRTGDEDVRLNLQKNSELDVRPPVFVMRAGQPLRADVMQAKPGAGFYQDPDTGASFSVRFHDSGSGYLLNGAYYSGNAQYLLTPRYRHTGSGIGDHDVTKMTSDVSLQNDFLDLLSSGAGDSSEPGKDNPHDYSDVTNEDARKTTGHDVLDSSQAAGSDVTRRVRRRRQASQGTFTLELLMVVDYGVYEKWLSRMQGSTEEARKQAAIGNITEYYSFILNGVDLRYAGINANFSIDVSFAGILVFDDPMDTYWSGGRLAVGSPRDLVEASEALETFRGWALRLGASLPPSDHVMLFTGFNLTYGGSVSNAGLAYLGSACNTDYYFSIVEEYLDFRTVAVAAHELAHSLGARHDMDGNTCLTFDRYIMTSRFRFPTARTAQNPWKFSSCSVQYFSDFIDDLFRNDTNCLVTRDAVTSSVEIQPFLVSLPGQVYPNDQFCQLSEGEGSYICRDKHTDGYDTTCYAGLQCYRPEFGDCDLKLPPDGLACGDKKWCENGTCVFSPQAVSAVDDLCPFGDNPVLLTAGGNCSERVRVSRADCYGQAFRAQCCESCAAVRRDDLPGCEFGDRVETCNSLLCATDNHTLVRQNCCETCAIGLLAQASLTRSTDTHLATRPPAATAGARPELPTVSVLDDASAQTGSSFLSFHTYEVPPSPSLPPDQAPEMTMGTAPSLLPRSDQHTETYKAGATSSLPPDKLNEIPEPFTPLLFPPYQSPEMFKAFTRVLPPLDQRPEIHKGFTPPLHTPDQRPEILKEFTPPLQSPDQRPEILKEFTPPLQTPDQRPEILKEFTPPLQSPDRPAISQGEITHTPVFTDPLPLLPKVHTFPMSDAPSLTQVENTSPVPIVTAISFNETVLTVGVSSDHDETLLFVETTVVMTNSSDRESSLAQPLVTSRTIAFDTATTATTSAGFIGSPEKVTSADRTSTHVVTRGTSETTLAGLGKSRDRTINAGPVTLFGLMSSDTTTGGSAGEDNLASVAAIRRGSDPPFPSAVTLGPPDVTPLSDTQSVAGWTSLSQSAPGLTSVPDSHPVATFRLDPTVTSALGTTPVPNATSAPDWPWVPGVTSVLSSESILIAASVPGLTSSPSDASQPVLPASAHASTSRGVTNTTPPITTPSASKDRSSATTGTVRPAVTSRGNQGREGKREGGQDRENRARDADRQKTQGGPVRHGGGAPPPSRLGPQPRLGAGQKERGDARQRESEGSVSMETEVEEEPRGEREGGHAGTISSSEDSALLSRDTSKERQLTPDQLGLGGGLQVQKVREAGRSNTGSDVTRDQRLSGLIDLLLLLQNLKSADLQLVTSELSALGGDFGDGTFHLPLSRVGAGVKDTNSRSRTPDEEQSTNAVSFQRASLAHSSLASGDGSRPQRGRVKAGDLSDPAIGQRSARRQVWTGRRHRNSEAGGSSRRRRRRRSSGSLEPLADAMTTFDRHPLKRPLQAVRSERGPELVAVSPSDRPEARSARRQKRDSASFESSSRDSQQAEAQDHDLAARWRHVPEGRPQQSSTESHLPVLGDEAARDAVYHYDDDEDEHDSADSADATSLGQTAFSREDGNDDRNDDDAVALSQGLSRVGRIELEADEQRNPESDVGGATSDDDETDVSDENDTDSQPDNEDVTVGPSTIHQHKISDVALGPPPDVTSSSGEEIFQKVPTPDDETVNRPSDAADDDSRNDDDRDTYKNTDVTVDEDNTEKGNNSEADENHKDGKDEDSKDANNDSEGETDQKNVQRHVIATGNANGDGNSSSNNTDDKDDDVGGGDNDLENTSGAKTEEPVANRGSVADGQPDLRRDLSEAFRTEEPVDDDSFVKSAWSGAGRDSLEDSTLESVADDQPPEFQAGSIQAMADDPTERPVSHARTGLLTDVRAGGSDPPDGDFGRARPPSDRHPDILPDEGDTIRDTASSGDAMGVDDDDQQVKGEYVAGSYDRIKNIENFDNNFQRWTPSLPTVKISDRGDNATGSEDVVISHDDVITGSEGMVTHRERAESEQVTVGGGMTREVEANTKSSDADPNTSRRPLSGGRPGWTGKMADSGVAGRTTHTDNDTRGGGKIHNGSDPERTTPTGGRDSSVINASLDDGVSTYKTSSHGEGMSERLEDLQGRPRRKLNSGNTSDADRDAAAGRPQDVTSHAGRQPSGKSPARATRLGYSLPLGQAVMAEVTSRPVVTSKTTSKYTGSAAAGKDGRAGRTPLHDSVGLTFRSTLKPGHIRVDRKDSGREGTRRGGPLKSSHSR